MISCSHIVNNEEVAPLDRSASPALIGFATMIVRVFSLLTYDLYQYGAGAGPEVKRATGCKVDFFSIFLCRFVHIYLLNKRMIFYVIPAMAAVFLIAFLAKADPGPIGGVYSRRGKWFTLKYWLFFALFKLRQRKSQRQAAAAAEGAGYGMKSRNSVEEMDRVQELPSEHRLVTDSTSTGPSSYR